MKGRLGIIWTKEEEPLSEEALKEMRHVMNGILDKSLDHDQTVWHETSYVGTKRNRNGEDVDQYACGTAHCFAGWGELLAFKAKKEGKSFFEVTPVLTKPVENAIKKHHDTCFNKKYETAGDYCEDRWGLGYYERRALFTQENSKKDLNYMVTMFEKGYRMEYYDMFGR